MNLITHVSRQPFHGLINYEPTDVIAVPCYPFFGALILEIYYSISTCISLLPFIVFIIFSKRWNRFRVVIHLFHR